MKMMHGPIHIKISMNYTKKKSFLRSNSPEPPKQFLEFYETPMFITVFTLDCLLSLFKATLIQFHARA